jgi:hypothetical protein
MTLMGARLLTREMQRMPYIVAPSTRGANSAPPKSNASLLVGCPDAAFSLSSKMEGRTPGVSNESVSARNPLV